MDFHSSRESNSNTLASTWHVVNRLPICEEETDAASQQSWTSLIKTNSTPVDVKIRSSNKR